MDKNTLKMIIDAVFAELHTAVAGKWLLALAVDALHTIALGLIDKIVIATAKLVVN